MQFPLPDLFHGITLTDANSGEVVHEVAEICLFQSFLERVHKKRGRYLMDKTEARLQRLLGVSRREDIPPEMVSRVSSEASELVRGVGDARLVEIAYLEDGEKKKTYLPVSAFSQGLRQRIYDYLSRPAKEELEMFRQMKDQLAYYDKAVRHNKEIIDDLSRLLRVREVVDVSAEISRLRADLQDLKETRDELKRQCQTAGEAQAETMFRKLKQVQERFNQMVSELQKLEQKREEGA